MRWWRVISVVLLALTGGCAARDAPGGGPDAVAPVLGFEAVSLSGVELSRPVLSAERERALEADLARARGYLERAPGDVLSSIWVGRRLGYLGRFREAVDVFGAAITRFPDEPRLLRHRGHRNITLRRLDAAVDDLTRAAELARGRPDELEPDGAPNAWGVPRSTTQSNIYYHLGLAHYLRGEYGSAMEAYRRGLDYAVINDDMLTAYAYWMSNTAIRLGERELAMEMAALAHPSMQILENHAYHRLLGALRAGSSESLLLEMTPGDLDWITTAYGISMSRELAGDGAGARLLREAVTRTDAWPAFGFIAAEADLARGADPR